MLAPSSGEGGYEQLGKRLEDLRAEVATLRAEVRTELGELRQDVRRVNGRLDWLVAGVFLAILAPVLVRLFLP